MLALEERSRGRQNIRKYPLGTMDIPTKLDNTQAPPAVDQKDVKSNIVL